ncbi:MAG: hypothetical protein U0992_15900 [Planctomycetaceae bacterium]
MAARDDPGVVDGNHFVDPQEGRAMRNLLVGCGVQCSHLDCRYNIAGGSLNSIADF